MSRLLLALLLLCASCCLRAATDGLAPVPALQARVTDTTGLLAPDQRAALEQKLAAFEQRKGSQLGMLIVPTTAPEAIEQYGIRVAEQWKLGRDNADDGLILIVARQDRKLRIEVGYGLEGVIPDAIAKRVIAETIVPRFQAGDFAGGIQAGVDQLIGLIDGEPLPPPPAASAGSQDDNPLGMLVLGALFVGQVLRAVLGPVLGGGVIGTLVLGAAWFLGASAGQALLLGLAGFVVTALGLMNLLSQGGHAGGGRGRGLGGGGFRGGGGGFGGGGASGGW